MSSDFLLGCTYNFIQPHDRVSPLSRFEMVRDAGVFDYINWLPPDSILNECLRASERTGIPMTTGNCSIQIGRDEDRLLRNVHKASSVGMKLLNVMLQTYAVDGHEITDDEIIDLYQRAEDIGAGCGVKVSYEIHVDCWTERYLRVTPIIEKMKARGIKFALTIDYSHVIFKITNAAQQEISGVREALEQGRVVLDPFEEGNLCSEWLSQNVVEFAQFRPVSPRNPVNFWGRGEDGSLPRGIMYPFTRPEPGQWHSYWQAHELAACKEAFRTVMAYHLTHEASPLKYVITEMIPSADYGLNAKFSLLEHNAAAAAWIRASWSQLKAMRAAGIPLQV